MARLSVYNKANVTVNVDGVTSTLFADEFAISLEYPDDSSSLTVGLNEAVTSLNTNKTATATLNLFPTSPVNDQLYTLFDNARNGAGREFDMTVYTGVNEKISCIGCSISQMGNIRTGGVALEAREYTILVRQFDNDPQP